MAGYYRLNALGFRVAPGSFVLPAEEFAPVVETSELGAAARREADRILADARSEADRMSSAAVEACEAEKRRGFEEGARDAQMKAMERLLRENVVLDAKLRRIEKDLSALVVACTRKLIEGFDDLARAEAVAKAALKTMRHEKKAELRVPSALYPRFRQSVTRFATEFPEIELIDVVEDATLVNSQIIVETAVGRVDGDLAQRLDDLDALLRGAHAEAHSQAKEEER
jgi:type III secretion protein L